MWEMKGDKYTKTFAKIQVRRIFRIRDIRKKCFTQTYRDLYGDDMMVPTWMGTNMVDGNQQNICYRVLVQVREFVARGTHKH